MNLTTVTVLLLSLLVGLLLLSCCEEESEDETVILMECVLEIESEEGGVGVNMGVRVSNPGEETDRDMVGVWIWCIHFGSCLATP